MQTKFQNNNILKFIRKAPDSGAFFIFGRIMKRSILLPLLFITISCLAQKSVIGKWKTIDDNTGEAKSIVEIFERGSKVFGKIVSLVPKAGRPADPVCDNCPEDDARYKKKIIGMEIIQNLVKDGDDYSEGTVLDPESGKIYRCKIWLEGNDLKLRGYIGPFFRTQTWTRVN
jgi:uncharacterized protein (DUF2147 family)